MKKDFDDIFNEINNIVDESNSIPLNIENTCRCMENGDYFCVCNLTPEDIYFAISEKDANGNPIDCDGDEVWIFFALKKSSISKLVQLEDETIEERFGDEEEGYICDYEYIDQVIPDMLGDLYSLDKVYGIMEQTYAIEISEREGLKEKLQNIGFEYNERILGYFLC